MIAAIRFSSRRRISLFAMDSAFLAILLIGALVSSNACASTPPASAFLQAVADIEAPYREGRLKEAISKGRDLLGVERGSNSRAAYLIARRLQEMCFRARNTECIDEFGKPILELGEELRQAKDLPQADRERVTNEALVTVLRVYEWHGHYPDAERFAALLEKALQNPFAFLDFIQASLTYAEYRLERNDLRGAFVHTLRAWLYLLSAKNVQDGDFLHYLPRFIHLFRSTGQLKRSITALSIVEPTTDALTNLYRYEGLAMLLSKRDVLVDLRMSDKVALTTKAALEHLKSLDMPIGQRMYEEGIALAELMINCLMPGVKQCDIDSTKSELTRWLAEWEALPNKNEDAASHTLVAFALAFHGGMRQTRLPPSVIEILKKASPRPSTLSAVSDAAMLEIAAYMMERAEGGSGDQERLVKACHDELTRLRRLAGATPFSVAPINGYSRAVLELAASALMNLRNRTSADDEMLLEIARYLNRDFRHIESQYLFLLSRLAQAGHSSQLQSLYGIDGALLAREKKALAELTEELWSRTPERPPGSFDVATWGRFSDLVDLALDRNGVYEAALDVLREERATLREIQGALHDDERLIVLANTRTNTGLVRLCVSKQGVAIAGAPLESPADLIAIKTLQAALTNPMPPSEEADAQFPVAAAARLSALVVGTDEQCVGDAKHLIFSPPGWLLGIPFQALLEPAAMKTRPVVAAASIDASMPWLGRTRAISMVVDPEQLIASRALRGRPASSSGFVGIGDPRLRGNTLDGEDRLEFALRGARRAAAEGVLSLDELPDTAKELEKVAAEFGKDSVLLLGEDATELDFRRQILSDVRVISFATHGLLSDEVEGVPEASLLLTPVDTKAEIDDGLLTATEISRLELNADLVILSACNSARFDVGVFGPEAAALSSSFFIAGARSTLASLWSVESRATARLMSLFAEEYAAQMGGGPAGALQRAIDRFVASPERPEYLHPRFWAPFVLFGDGGISAAPSATEEPSRTGVSLVPRDGNGTPGEFIFSASFAGGLALAGFREESGGSTVSELVVEDGSGKPRWRREERDRGFMLARGAEGKTLAVLSYAKAASDANRLEVRWYDSGGRMARRTEIPVSEKEIPVDFIQIGGNGLLIATRPTAIGEPNQEVVVRRVSARGKVTAVTRVRAPEDLGLVSARVFGTKDVAYVALAGLDQARIKAAPVEIGPLGAPRGCLRYATEMVKLSHSLKEFGERERIGDAVVHDVLPLDGGREVLAVEIKAGCRVGASDDALLLRSADGAQSLRKLGFPGFSSAPRRLVRISSERIALLGSVTRDAGMEDAAASPGDFKFGWHEFRRRLSTARQHGSYVRVLDAELQPHAERVFFAGTILSLLHVTPVGDTLFAGGSVGDRQFLGELRVGAVH